MAVGLAATLLPCVPADGVRPLTLAEVQREVDRLHHEAELATERYDELGERLRGQRVLVQAAQDRVVQQRLAIATTRRLLGRWGVEAYRRGTLATVAVALGEDPEALIAHSGLVVSLADQKEGLLRRLRRQEGELNRSAELATRRAGELAGLVSAQAAARTDVLHRLAAAEQLLAGLKDEQRRALERASRDAERAAVGATGDGDGAGAGPRVDDSAAGDARTDKPRQRRRPHGPRRPERPTGGRDAGDDGVGVGCGSVDVSGADPRAAAAIRFACAQLGEPYRWGAAGPGAWDCSGLTMRAWARAGVRLPHSSRLQYGYGRRVDAGSLQPGDLVFFYHPISHVGLYLGRGLMIHAPHTGDVVRIAAVYDGAVGGVRLS